MQTARKAHASLLCAPEKCRRRPARTASTDSEEQRNSQWGTGHRSAHTSSSGRVLLSPSLVVCVRLSLLLLLLWVRGREEQRPDDSSRSAPPKTPQGRMPVACTVAVHCASSVLSPCALCCRCVVCSCVGMPRAVLCETPLTARGLLLRARCATHCATQHTTQQQTQQHEQVRERMAGGYSGGEEARTPRGCAVVHWWRHSRFQAALAPPQRGTAL
jgi:hypothetical protein